MKRILLFTWLSILSVGWLHAQWTVVYLPGYGTYRMQNMINYQEKHLENVRIPGRIVTQFPGFVNHQLLIGKQINGATKSFQLGYLTTSGRTSYSDYSGKWTYDLVNMCYQAGVNIAFWGVSFSRWNLKPYVNVSVNTSVLLIREELIIRNEEQHQDQKFIAFGLSGQPGFFFTRRFRNFEPGIFLGYELHVSQKFLKNDHNKFLLGYSSEELVNPSWTGIRTGLYLSCRINSLR